jgi:hypothetical protein
MQTHWKRLIGALVVLAIGVAAFAPASGMYRSASRPAAAGRMAASPLGSQLSTADAAAGLSRAGQPADEKPADEKPAGDGPVVIQPDHMDLSPPLADIAPAVPPPAEPTLMRFWERELLPGHEKEGSFSGVDASYQTWHGPEAMPAPIQNWDGINNVGFTVRPPDTVGDVGPNHYVQWVNVRFQIWNKSGVSLYGPAAGNTLWSGFGGKCQTTNDGDPVVLYDHLANRWVMMQFALGTVGDGTSDLLCFAVSQTPDPLGSWYRYSFTWPNTYFPDYPKLGLWPDGYYVSVNQFNDAGTAWRGAGVLAMERAQMLTGAAAQAVYFNGYSYNSAYGGLLPADWDGATPPPGGAANPFAAWDDSAWIAPSDALRIWNFHVDWATPANSYFGTAGSPFVPTHTLNTANVDPTLCAASPACIDQPGTTVNLDDLADRLMHRLQYRNFGGYQALVGNHTVDTNSPAGRAGIHWFELRNSGGGWAINQEGTYGPADNTSTSRWMGSIAMDSAGNMALGYSITDNVSLYPSIRYAGRLATDTPGALPQSETTLVTGGGYQNDSFNRWGDYSAMHVDPTDDCTFWYTQEYAQTSGAFNWYTRIGSFKFPACGTPDFTVAAAPASQEICLGSSATVAITVGSVGGFISPVTLSAAFSPAGPGASFGPNPVTPAGVSTLTVSGAAAGTTSVTVTGTSGALSRQASATLNVATPLAAAPALTAPANASTGASITPTFAWNAVAGVSSYEIQVAADPAFSAIVASATGLAGTSWTPASALASAQAHYWRVRAVNGCGAGPYAPVAAFVTAAGGTNTFCRNVNLSIPDNSTTGVTDSQTLATSGALTDLNVSVRATHTWVGDLIFTVRHVGANTSATVIDRPGVPAAAAGCAQNHVNATLDDEASQPVENQCAASAGATPPPYAIDGAFTPNNPLSAFDGQNLASTWELNVSDRAGQDTGTLTQWCLIATYGVALTADFSDLASTYGAAWHTGSGSLRLGPGWTADASFAAEGDNASDDGVAFISNFTVGQPATLRVDVQGTPASGRWLRVWFDWDSNGVFDTTEKVYDGTAVTGNNDLPVSVPAGLAGAVKYRVRLYDSAGAPAVPDAIDAASHGGASGGEVEDGASPSPLAVTLAGFSAVQQGGLVLVAWETVSELDNIGFNLYRSDSAAGPLTWLALIPSQAPGSAQGFAYDYDDLDVQSGQTYWYTLEDISLSGATTLHGPVSATVQAPTAVRLSGSVAAGAGSAGSASLAGALAGLALAGLAWRRRQAQRARRR